MGYGLRFKRLDGVFVSLLQIAGGGRIKLSDGARVWWSRPPPGVTWEAYPATKGHVCDTQAAAKETAKNLAEVSSAIDRDG